MERRTRRDAVILARDESVDVRSTCWSCHRDVHKVVAAVRPDDALSWYCGPCDVGWTGRPG